MLRHQNFDMRGIVRGVCAAVLLALLAACGASEDDPHGSEADVARRSAAELHRAADPAAVLDAARALAAADTNAALVTVGEDGRPRARTVTTSRPDRDFVIWIATRPETRKVDQIRNEPRVTLYYDHDDAGTYLTVMGTATLHDDAATLEAHNFYSLERTREYWPDYPDGMVLIRVAPDWLEMVGPDVPAQEFTWRPQAVEMAP